MSVELVGLAVLMFAVTYPARAIPLLVPRFEHLPPRAARVPAAGRPRGPRRDRRAVEVLIDEGPAGRPVLTVGPEALAVVACAAIVAWRRNLALGLLVAVTLTALMRAAGIA